MFDWQVWCNRDSKEVRVLATLGLRALGEGMIWQPSTEVDKAILFTAGGLTAMVFLEWWKVVGSRRAA